jgi:hypothetical protein
MNGLARRVLALGLLVGLAVGCAGGLTPIPSGAQQLHIAETERSLDLQPGTVRAGDVYVVLDGPRQSVVLVTQKRTAEATPGPMSDDDLDRLSRGDTEGTSIEGISVACSAEQRAAARGKVGYCGNVYRFKLVPGTYAFLLDPPEGDPPQPVPPGSMAVLAVTP